jgi:PadR family transcriptional regulator PadR
MDREVRLSQQSLTVLRLLLDRPLEESSGAEIARATGLGSGTLYPILARLEGAAWLTSRWENVKPRGGTPRRRLYKL